MFNNFVCLYVCLRLMSFFNHLFLCLSVCIFLWLSGLIVVASNSSLLWSLPLSKPVGDTSGTLYWGLLGTFLARRGLWTSVWQIFSEPDFNYFLIQVDAAAFFLSLLCLVLISVVTISAENRSLLPSIWCTGATEVGQDVWSILPHGDGNLGLPSLTSISSFLLHFIAFFASFSPHLNQNNDNSNHDDNENWKQCRRFQFGTFIRRQLCVPPASSNLSFLSAIQKSA